MLTINTTTLLLDSIFWLTLIAVIVSSASGVLKAGFLRFDLFGIIIIGITTGLGGGSIRDMLLDRDVFWIKDQVFFIASFLSSAGMFFLARFIVISHRFFLVPDAAGLATFSVSGTLVSYMAGAPWFVASFMGVMTGIMGGILRDVLCNEHPVVFQSPLYATVSWGGSLLFVALLNIQVDINVAVIATGILIFVARLMAIYFNICLPKFHLKIK